MGSPQRGPPVPGAPLRSPEHEGTRPPLHFYFKISGKTSPWPQPTCSHGEQGALGTAPTTHRCPLSSATWASRRCDFALGDQNDDQRRPVLPQGGAPASSLGGPFPRDGFILETSWANPDPTARLGPRWATPTQRVSISLTPKLGQLGMGVWRPASSPRASRFALDPQSWVPARSTSARLSGTTDGTYSSGTRGW